MFINPINITQNNQLRKSQYSQKTGNVENLEINSHDIAGYQVGKAMLASSGISFKNLSMPIEVTDKYNKKVEGKDHLDLPNIHVYEYPDTNLRVMVDENENMKGSSLIEARLYLKTAKINNNSQIKKELFKDIISFILEEKKIPAVVNSSNQGPFTIVVTTPENKKEIFTKINDIITNVNITEDVLDKHKQKLIQKLKNDNGNGNDYILLAKDCLKSKESCVEELHNLTLQDFQNYSEKIIGNSEATYFVTINKNHFDSKNKISLFKELNTGIKKQFNISDNNSSSISYVLNNNSAIYVNDKNVEGLEFDYPYEENNLRACIIGLFTNLLLFFLAEPFYDKNSDKKVIKIPLQINSKNEMCVCHNLKFNIPKPEFTNLTPQRALSIQKEIVGMVYDTDFTVTLNDIKQVFKEKFNEEINQNYKNDLNNQNMYQYGYDIFQLYEILDSIQTKDIKQHMEKYFFNQEPIVRFNNKSKEIAS